MLIKKVKIGPIMFTVNADIIAPKIKLSIIPHHVKYIKPSIITAIKLPINTIFNMAINPLFKTHKGTFKGLAFSRLTTPKLYNIVA